MKKFLRSMARDQKGGLATYAAQFVLVMAVMLAGVMLIGAANTLAGAIAEWVVSFVSSNPSPF